MLFIGIQNLPEAGGVLPTLIQNLLKLVDKSLKDLIFKHWIFVENSK